MSSDFGLADTEIFSSTYQALQDILSRLASPRPTLDFGIKDVNEVNLWVKNVIVRRFSPLPLGVAKIIILIIFATHSDYFFARTVFYLCVFYTLFLALSSKHSLITTETSHD